MFDVTQNDILALDEEQLRELVALLCEAELISQGLSSASVQAGGHQNATDGGVDVRVERSTVPSSDAYIPRAFTTFQVKVSELPPAKIAEEMRPEAEGGVLRPAIAHLAGAGGAYILVSAKATTSATHLDSRRDAMRAALFDDPNRDQLHVDFYDRSRLASWVRCHPGLVPWVRSRAGRDLRGWQPYGSWSGGAARGGNYLPGTAERLNLGLLAVTRPASPEEAIDQLRDRLRVGGSVIRLIGLSGVGKTRLAEALFDSRVGERALSSPLAVYTNLEQQPSPSPPELVAHLLASRQRAIVIVDNCTAELHALLVDAAAGDGSTVSLLTIEYDVRLDQPEGTHVVRLGASSFTLIEELVRSRFAHVSAVNRRTIAEVSGGNARIALALAETFEATGGAAEVSGEQLFQRLFQQRHGENADLRAAAEALSLVYSFDGESIGPEADLEVLAGLADMNAKQMHRHIATLEERQLVQRRAQWRAVLPHAIANRLAGRALRNLPRLALETDLVDKSARMAQSFTRRLGYLHNDEAACCIAEAWLAEGGRLGDFAKLDAGGKSMLLNLAPVAPEAALALLERSISVFDASFLADWNNVQLLRSIAYDPDLFERSAQLLAQSIIQTSPDDDRNGVRENFASMFGLVYSGTHARQADRQRVVQGLIDLDVPSATDLAALALRAALETRDFRAAHRFDFGARARDFGYLPADDTDAQAWYRSWLGFLADIVEKGSLPRSKMLKVLTDKAPDLWADAGVGTELDALFRRGCVGFWAEGWRSCRIALQSAGHAMLPTERALLQSLTAELAPITLEDRVRGYALGEDTLPYSVTGIASDDVEALQAYWEEHSQALGNELAGTPGACDELASALLLGGGRAVALGRGMGQGSEDPRATWRALLAAVRRTPPGELAPAILLGLLHGVAPIDLALAQDLIDEARQFHQLRPFLVDLQCAVRFDQRGVALLIDAAREGDAPLSSFRNPIASGQFNHLPGTDFHELVSAIGADPDGYELAMEATAIRFAADSSAGQPADPAVVALGRRLLACWSFLDAGTLPPKQFGTLVAGSAEGGSEGALAAEGFIHCLIGEADAALMRKAWAFEALSALFAAQPKLLLDRMLQHVENAAFLKIFTYWGGYSPSPLDAVELNQLSEWCHSDPDARIAFVARFIRFAATSEPGGPLRWTEQAVRLFDLTSDPDELLTYFFVKAAFHLDLVRPQSATLEALAGLLDDRKALARTNPAAVALVRSTVEELASTRRETETDDERALHPRFE